jgi:aldehyde dehydrogenase family 7 protein A1
VIEASPDDVEMTIKASREAYLAWRHVPAPRRGEILRLIRGALNDQIEDLGKLVTMEMGKIKSEVSVS